jgi:uncharacterized DUF497 family protein
VAGEKVRFQWDDQKALLNLAKHGVTFEEAQEAFDDPGRVIARDILHGVDEERFYCFAKVSTGAIMTVRFTYRGDAIRIIGAGYWRDGRRVYEQAHK